MMLLALLLACLCACTTTRKAAPEDERTRHFVATAYQPAEAHRVATKRFVFELEQESVELELLRPESAAPAPLVIYLPGLGESCRAGGLWRRGWAEAGYAVLSVQPLAADASAWSSDLAHAGDFLALERQRFAEAAMKARLHMLAVTVREARRRASAGDPDWQRIAFDRAALAGFDLGGFAAMVEAGELLPNLDVEGAALPIPVAAILVLSPFATFEASGFSTRYRAIQSPVMSITSDVDRDPIGLVSSPLLRTVPFASMASGDKYLLLLTNIPHAVVGGSRSGGDAGKGGSSARSTDSEAGSGADPGPTSGPAAGSGSRRRRGRDSSGSSNNRAEEEPRTEQPQPPDSGALRRGTVAIAATSTAFLDAYVKGDDLARRWLDSGVAAWLRQDGELRRK